MKFSSLWAWLTVAKGPNVWFGSESNTMDLDSESLDVFFPHSILQVHDEVSLCVTVLFSHPTIDSILIGLPFICFLALSPSQTSPLRFPGNTSAMGCRHGRQSGYICPHPEWKMRNLWLLQIFRCLEDNCFVVGLQSSHQVIYYFSNWSGLVSLWWFLFLWWSSKWKELGRELSTKLL